MFVVDNTTINNQPMDTSVVDGRHLRRVALMQALFALEFAGGEYQALSEELDDQEVSALATKIFAKREQLDEQIQQYALERPLAEINKIDLAILRLIVFESNNSKTPKKVLVDEAVELAKEFGGENSPKFINGVLGKLLIGS